MPRLIINVVDVNTNKPVPNAIVTVNGVAAVTNINGQVSFQAQPASYSVNVSRNNYTPTTQLVTLATNQITTIKIVPRVGLL